MTTSNIPPAYAKDGLENKIISINDIYNVLQEIRDLLLVSSQVVELKKQDLPKIINSLQGLLSVAKVFL